MRQAHRALSLRVGRPVSFSQPIGSCSRPGGLAETAAEAGRDHALLVKEIRKTGGADGPVRGRGWQPVQPAAFRVGVKLAGVCPGGGLGETALPVSRLAFAFHAPEPVAGYATSCGPDARMSQTRADRLS